MPYRKRGDRLPRASRIAVAAQWLAGFVVVAALGGPAPAQEVVHSLVVTRITQSSTATRGGEGGSPFNLSCDEGQVLIGVNARQGWYVDRLQGICRPITSSGAWTGSESTTGSAGGNSGNAVTRRCPTGFALSGFSGRQGGLLDRLELECTRLDANATFNTSVPRQTLGAIGGNGGTAFGTTRCSRPARAIVGRAGMFIDSVQLGCEHGTPLMTQAQIDAALSGATSILKADNDGRFVSDVPCDLTLRRSGRILKEPSNGLLVVDNATEFSRACGLPGFVVVTQGISWCGGLGAAIVGCAPVPGNCMVVVPLLGNSAADRAQLWAHERGHTRGLPHRSSSPNNIMFPSLASGTHVITSECTSFRTN